MTSTDARNEAAAQLASARRHLGEVLGELRQVLREDLAAFPGREGKKRFVDSGDLGQGLSDEALGTLKRDLDAVASGVVQDVLAQLEADGPWLALSALPESERSTLESAKAVTGLLASVAEAVEAVLERHGFPPELREVGYRTPTWFIGGRYMPGLIEKYWAWLAKVRELEAALEEERRSDTVRDLARRWEEA